MREAHLLFQILDQHGYDGLARFEIDPEEEDLTLRWLFSKAWSAYDTLLLVYNELFNYLYELENGISSTNT